MFDNANSIKDGDNLEEVSRSGIEIFFNSKRFIAA
jgi:hypothetical protein